MCNKFSHMRNVSEYTSSTFADSDSSPLPCWKRQWVYKLLLMREISLAFIKQALVFFARVVGDERRVLSLSYALFSLFALVVVAMLSGTVRVSIGCDSISE